jgi:hypothetical protein
MQRISLSRIVGRGGKAVQETALPAYSAALQDLYKPALMQGNSI